MLRLANFLWKDVSSEELKKFGILSLALLCIIGTYWIIRPIKDVIFLTLVNKTLLPHAKIASLITLIPLLIMYSKLVDLLRKHHLVYFLNTITCLFFSALAIIILYTPHFFTQHSFLSQIVGWIAFIGSECLLVLQFNLFWSFVASSMNTQTAKKGYPIIVAGAQIGAIAGPLLTMKVAAIGVPHLLFLASFFIVSSAMVIKVFTSKYHMSNSAAPSEKKSTGALEGLRLLTTQPYLMGILFISVLPDIIGEILNLSMLLLAKTDFKTPEEFIAFLGVYGILVNTASFVFAFFGTNLFLRRWGLANGLLLYPLILAVVVLHTWIFYSLWSIIIAMVILKGLEHALDQPCREMMFIPTSTDIKFKAKSWISVFGGRSARGIGAGLVALFVATGNLIFFGSLVSLCMIGLWIPAARFVGRTNDILIRDNQILE